MLKIATCSWKYDSWKGLIYSENAEKNYLKEYAEHYNCVEVDQWFWSLFGEKVVLPDIEVVKEYKNSVPKDLHFIIKAPNSITLTHHYNKNKKEPLIQNPHFLSNELFEEFLKTIKPIHNQTPSIILQFEYLNKQKMPSLSELQNRLFEFMQNIPKYSPPISIEIRNPNYLNESYFKFLNQIETPHVFLEGYYMPPVTEIYSKYKDLIKGMTIIRLHGPDRKGIEKISNQNWNQIYINRDKELKPIVEMMKDLQTRKVDIYLNINNHYEGSAPLTIEKVKKALNK